MVNFDTFKATSHLGQGHTALLNKALNTAFLAFFTITDCSILFGKTFWHLQITLQKILDLEK